MVVYGGGGTSSQRLELSGASGERGESMRGGGGGGSLEGVRGSSPGIFFKIYVFKNAFQAVLKPSFPYSINSILNR